MKHILRKGLVLPFCLGVLLIVASLLSIEHLRSAQLRVDRGNVVVKQAHELEVFATNAQRDFRGYWFSGQKELLEMSRESEKKFDETFVALEKLANEGPALEKLNNLKKIFQEWHDLSNQMPRETSSSTFHTKSSELLRRTTESAEAYLQTEREVRAGLSDGLQLMASRLIAAIVLFTLILGGLFIIFGRQALVQISESFVRALASEKMAQEHLKAALDSRDEFMSIASHELKTPLTSLKLQLMITERIGKKELTDMPFGEQLDKAMATSLRQIDSLNRLIDDLLDVARITAGTLTLAPKKTDLSALVEDVVKTLDEQVRAAKSSIRLVLQKDLVGWWDRSRLEQVVVNLVSNAIKYAPRKPIQISTRGDGSHATLIVEDFGPGIAKDKLEKIFDRFERANSEANVQGLGLGLFIVKKIVEAHAGSIEVQSETGSGSRFIVALPLRSESGEKADGV